MPKNTSSQSSQPLRGRGAPPLVNRPDWPQIKEAIISGESIGGLNLRFGVSTQTAIKYRRIFVKQGLLAAEVLHKRNNQSKSLLDLRQQIHDAAIVASNTDQTALDHPKLVATNILTPLRQVQVRLTAEADRAARSGRVNLEVEKLILQSVETATKVLLGAGGGGQTATLRVLLPGSDRRERAIDVQPEPQAGPDDPAVLQSTE